VAKVVHGYEFAKGGRSGGCWSNRWATVVRAYPTPLLLLVLPALLAAEPAVWAVALRGGWARMKALATLDLVRALPGLLRERRMIQPQRDVSAWTFAAAMTPELDSPYFGRVGRHPLVRRWLGLYWTALSTILRLAPHD
jgi:hypothetical protein